MEYAFIDSLGSLTYNNGVRIQAIMWKDGLEELGHKVKLINLWEKENFANYDAIIIFGLGANIYKLVNNLIRINTNIVLAPIIDPHRSDRFFRFLFKYYGCTRLFLSNHYHDTWTIRNKIKLWLVRSEEELHYVNFCLSIPLDRIAKVPLNYRLPNAGEINDKESFCLHVSRLDSPNKNVPRLIEAAKKYGFNLKLAGHVFGEKEKNDLQKLIAKYDNIEYLGEVSEGQLLDLYRRAKVFALPSLREGVGMVALEAAAYGCEIVLTNIGAPKEYFEDKAILVNPTDIDEIGKGVLEALNQKVAQPELKTYIENHYSSKVCCTLLNSVITDKVRNNKTKTS